MSKKLLSLVLLLTTVSLFLRIIAIGSIPKGLYVDEAALGYNAYSILKTGRDEYGKALPIFFRSFGDFKSPLYIYLSTVPVFLLDLTILSTRLISVISGVLIIIISFLLFKKVFSDKSAFLASVLMSLTPWSVFFSRGAFEANLGLCIFVLSCYLFLESLQHKKLFILASITLAISSYAYHAERLLSILFLGIFLALFYRLFRRNKKILILGVISFFILYSPQLLLLSSPGPSIRLTQQSYIQFILSQYHENNRLTDMFIKGSYLLREFFSQYCTYFSPRNLFFEPDPDLQRSIPNLSVFFSWMAVPFFWGFRKLLKNIKQPLIQIITVILVISPIPAALTKDPFSTIRALPFFWSLTIITGIGTIELLKMLPKKVSWITIVALSFLSLTNLYSNYFVILPRERAKDWGYHYQKLSEITMDTSQKFTSESRKLPTYILFAFFKKYDPVKMQENYSARVVKDYYDATNFNRSYIINNVEDRQINWKADPCINQILVADPLAISSNQAKDHIFDLVFSIDNPANKEALLNGFLTNPKLKCSNL